MTDSAAAAAAAAAPMIQAFYFRSLTQCDGRRGLQTFFPPRSSAMHSTRRGFLEAVLGAASKLWEEGDLDARVKKPTDIWAGAGPQWILPDQVEWHRGFLKRSRIMSASSYNGFFYPFYLRNPFE